MASKSDLTILLESRINCAKILLENGEFHMAAYLMGHVLECALKITICNTLGLDEYPSEKQYKDKQVAPFFKTHFIDRLVLLSGLTKTFSANGDKLEFDNWSQFSGKYEGDWVEMRYAEEEKLVDEPTAVSLYNNLIDDEHSIIKVIKKSWI